MKSKPVVEDSDVEQVSGPSGSSSRKARSVPKVVVAKAGLMEMRGDEVDDSGESLAASSRSSSSGIAMGVLRSEEVRLETVVEMYRGQLQMVRNLIRKMDVVED